MNRPVPIVRVIVTDPEGRVLFLRRAEGTAGGGQWCLPGGKIDYGEPVEEAAKRELEEETGLRWIGGEFLFYQDSPPIEPGAMHAINLYFHARTEGPLRINSESSDARWVGAGELDSLDIAFRNEVGIGKFFHAKD